MYNYDWWSFDKDLMLDFNHFLKLRFEFWIDSGLLWGYFWHTKLTLGPLWAYFGVTLGI